jgi:hypothetical protein
MAHQNIGSIGSASASIAPQTEIQSFISAIHTNLDSMDNAITALANRADGVLMPQRNEADSDDGRPEAEVRLSPLGEELRRINRILDYRNTMLRQIIDRIAL